MGAALGSICAPANGASVAGAGGRRRQNCTGKCAWSTGRGRNASKPIDREDQDSATQEKPWAWRRGTGHRTRSTRPRKPDASPGSPGYQRGTRCAFLASRSKLAPLSRLTGLPVSSPPRRNGGRGVAQVPQFGRSAFRTPKQNLPKRRAAGPESALGPAVVPWQLAWSRRQNGSGRARREGHAKFRP